MSKLNFLLAIVVLGVSSLGCKNTNKQITSHSSETSGLSITDFAGTYDTKPDDDQIQPTVIVIRVSGKIVKFSGNSKLGLRAVKCEVTGKRVNEDHYPVSGRDFLSGSTVAKWYWVYDICQIKRNKITIVRFLRVKRGILPSSSESQYKLANKAVTTLTLNKGILEYNFHHSDFPDSDKSYQFYSRK